MIDKARQWIYYFLIGFVSLLALVFIPLLGSKVGLQFDIPDTPAGWVVWVSTKVVVSTINVLIFHCFMQQAKLNVKSDANYLEARKLLMVAPKNKQVLPRSPKKWNSEQYGKKGVTIFFATALSTVALSQAILSYNYISLLVMIFTLALGVVFGVLQMKSAEEYWTSEYLKYAKYTVEQQKEKEEAAVEEAPLVEDKGDEKDDN